MRLLTCPFCGGPVGECITPTGWYMLVEREPVEAHWGDVWVDDRGYVHRTDLLPAPPDAEHLAAHVFSCPLWPKSTATRSWGRLGRQDHQFR